MILTPPPDSSRLVWWPIQSNLVNSVFFRDDLEASQILNPSPFPMNSARTSGSQSNHWATAACPRRFWADFVHIVDIFGRRASRLENLGAGVTNGQTSRQSDGSETRGGKGTTQPLQQILIVNKSRWRSTNTGSVTIHKYRIPDNPQIQDLWQSTNTGSTQTRSEVQNIQLRLSLYNVCCFTIMLYKIFIVSAWPDDVNIVVGWVNEHWRHLGSIVERYSFICYNLCPHSHGIGGWLDEKSRDCQCQTLAAFRQYSRKT